jgi:hypothetical protein
MSAAAYHDECLHGMNPAWCSHCLARSRPPVVPVPGPPFLARVDGHCSGCNLPIHPGQVIRRAGARYLHERCEP